MKKFMIAMGACLSLLGSFNPLSGEVFPDNYSSVFNGFYVGGNVGFINLDTTAFDSVGIIGLGLNQADRTHVTAGLQLGYDWVCGHRLLGLVADWNWTDVKTKIHTAPNSTFILDAGHRTRLSWFSTIRARAGLALCNTLFYLTGGAAVGDFKYRITNINTSLFNFQADSRFHKRQWGWTLGVGTEFAFCSRWTVNAELLYLNFEKKRFVVPVRRPGDNLTSIRPFYEYNTAWVGRVGLNYRFSFCNWCW